MEHIETAATPLKAIRAKCLDCSCGSTKEVRECELIKCALHPYRNGRNPNRKKKELSEEQKQAAAERLKKARKRKNAV